MKIFILCRNYYNYDSSEYNVGGIETYIYNLAVIFRSRGEVVVVQQSNRDFNICIDNIELVGVNVFNLSEKKRNVSLIKKAETLADSFDNDVLIFADEQIIVKSNFKKTIAIQHGISWDIPNYRIKHTLFPFYILRRSIQSIRLNKRIENVSKLICVDYNFVNWYRTQVPYSKVSLCTIPNFVAFNNIFVSRETKSTKRIIFARRFQWYRGTKLAAEVIKKIIARYDNVEVCFAGEGPDEDYLKSEFGDVPQVSFMKYNSKQAIEIHTKFDIAIVPTLGSEGTSLSLLEAMAAGCAVIATNVGGMTNIILNNYNGLLISPDAKSLFGAICYLIENNSELERLQKFAFETARKAFSISDWTSKWNEVLTEITKG